MSGNPIEYLTNFWEPAVGDTVGSSLITAIDDEFPNQIKLSGRDDWSFTQDLMWNPTCEQAVARLADVFGYRVFPDSTIQHDKRIYGPILDLPSLVEAIISIRVC